LANGTYLSYIEKADKTDTRWSHADSTVHFWYRQTPTYFAVRQILGGGVQGRVNSTDPPMEDIGMIRIDLDPQGRMVYFEEKPTTASLAEGTPVPTIDWNKMLTAAGFDPTACKPTQPHRNPPMFADTRMAWTAPMPERPDVTVTVEAAAYHGRLVHFLEEGPWTPAPGSGSGQSRTEHVSNIFALCILTSLLGGGIVLAWENYRKRRADLGGALRLAGFVLIVSVVTWVIGATHIAADWEAYSLTLELAWASLSALFLWMLYVALEPIARRRMPALLISWNRMLAGNFRDPMIGRDLLAGAALGVFSQVMGSLHFLYAGLRGLPPPSPDAGAFVILVGGRTPFAQPFSALVSSIFNGLAVMLMLVILQMLFRNRWIGAVAFMAIFVARVALQGGTVFDDVIQTIDIALLVMLILRFGLLAITIYIFVQQMTNAPITPDTSAWYAWMGFLGVAIIGVMIVYGARTALAGQPVFGQNFAAADD